MPESDKNHELSAAQTTLAEGAHLLGVKLTQVQYQRFQNYLALLLAWNAKINLTSIAEPSLIVRHHFLDSLAVSRFISPKGKLLDVGSGAGFPGLPLKIAFPEKEVCLVESRRKKVSFLKEVVRCLGLTGVEVFEGRVEDIDFAERVGFSEVVARALGKPQWFLHLAATILLPGGKALILHGPKGEELFHRLEDTVYTAAFRTAELKKFTLPLGEEKRAVLIFTK